MHAFVASLLSGLAVLIDEQEAEDILCLLLLLAGAVVYYVVSYRREKRRTARFQEIAEQSGRHFCLQDDGSLFYRFAHLPHFGKGYAWKIKNVLTGKLPEGTLPSDKVSDGEWVVFDYIYWLGPTRKYRYRESVFTICSPALDLPPVEMQAKSFFHHLRMVELEARPPFSKTYLQQGDVEPMIRALFDGPLRSFLESEDRIRIEGEGDQLIFYRPFTRTKLDELEGFVREGIKLFALYRDTFGNGRP